MTPILAASHDYCRRLTIQARSSFPIAFRLLPEEKRRAMFALYAFMRLTDDLADEPNEGQCKKNVLDDWRQQLDDALEHDKPTHPLHPALVDTIQRYNILPDYLHLVIAGVKEDLHPIVFAHFDELYQYCYRVASVVGLACLPIWGFQGDAHPSAEAAGIAFQLTNILRDLGEDHARGRVYLPSDELQRFNVDPDFWHEPQSRDAFRELMQFQVRRAWDYYAKSVPLRDCLSRDGRRVFGVMNGVYRQLLKQIERRNYDVFTQRVPRETMAEAEHLCPCVAARLKHDTEQNHRNWRRLGWIVGSGTACRSRPSRHTIGSTSSSGRSGWLVHRRAEWATDRCVSTCQYGLLH